jgi:osmoprotectant transport system substrate-binding protein
MRLSRTLALGATMLALVGACSSGGGGSTVAPSSAASSSAAGVPAVRIGSENFYESKLMAEFYAQVLEKAGYKVERNLGLGTRQERAPAFEAGQVDLVPEYVGSGLGYYDKTKTTSDGEANRAALAEILKTKAGGAQVFAITPGQDTNAFVVRPDTAAQYKLAKMSDLAAVQDKIKWALPADCDKNNLCKGALEQYGITYPPKQRTPLDACSAPIAQALQGKAVDLAELCSTQPAIAQFGFVPLEDDKKTQPAENIAPLVRDDFLAKVPDKAAFQKVLDDLSAKVTTEELTKLGVEIAVKNRDVAEVAKEWLTAQGLI